MGPGTSTRKLWQALLSLLLAAPALAYLELSDTALRRVPGGADALHPHTGELLLPILIPRRHIADFFARELPQWRLEWHNSTSRTPATGTADIPFANIALTRDPPWTKGAGDVGRLVLAAHYDSLYKPEGFIGAIDSAAPCAMLMQVARGVDAALTKKWEAVEASGDAGQGLEDDEKGVQILFLDGEEAWVSWSSTDSLYGSRSLAKKWEEEVYPAQSTYRTPLKAINLFVLLDLLGAADPVVPSYFSSTHWAYQNLAKIETRMRALGLLATTPKRPFLPDKNGEMFRGRGFVSDDHVPFMVRGVPILHIIPSPFPAVWHTMLDDADHLDLHVIVDWARILTAFVAEWFELEGLVDDDGIRARSEL